MNSLFSMKFSGGIQKIALLLVGVFFSIFLSVSVSFAAVPTVTSFTETSTPIAGGATYYDIGETVEITTVFSEAIDVTGTPSLKLLVGGKVFTLEYVSGTGSDTLLFSAVLPADLNDWGGVAATQFVTDVTNVLENATNESIVDDFADIDIVSLKIDTDTPVWEKIEFSSTGGSVDGTTRYINADDKIKFDFTIDSSDTREFATLTTTLSGNSFTVTTTSQESGIERTAGKSTSIAGAGDLDGMNGVVTSALFSLVNWQDKAGKNATGVPAYSLIDSDAGVTSLVVDTTPPVIVFDTNVSSGPTQSEDIQISVSDTNEDTSSYEYGFSADNICDASDTYGNSFTSATVFSLTTEINNGQYICVKSLDLAGNISYLASSNALNIDATAPVFTSASSINAEENQQSVITLVATDTNTVTYSFTGSASSLDEEKFTLTGSVLTFSAAPDFEDKQDSDTNNTYIVEVQAEDSVGHITSQLITVTLTDVNAAPTDITLTSDNTDENVADATVIGTLSGTDDGENTNSLTFALTCAVAGLDDGSFTIGGTDLILSTSPNFETKNSYAICIQVSDGVHTYDKNFTITVNDVNENPEITSNGGSATAAVHVEENQTAVTTVTSTDVDAGQVSSYSLSGDDADKFIITTGGVLTFVSAPDFETPLDTGDTAGNNTYVVVVTATDDGTGSLTATQTITITVDDVNENPEITSNGAGATAAITTPENQVSITQLTATDSDLPAQDIVFSISGGADFAKFEIVSSTGVLTFVTSPDFETPEDLGDTAGNNTYVVEITATDSGTGNLTDIQTLTIEVTDIDEIPPFIVITDNKTENPVNIASGDITFTFQFKQTVNGSDIADPVTGFEVSDVIITGGTPANSFASGTDNSDVYTLVVTPDANFEGNMTVNIAAEAATDISSLENKSLVATEYVQAVDTKSPTVSSVQIANGTPNQLTATFSEAVNLTDFSGVTITVVDGSGFILKTKTISSVTGTGTNVLVYTLASPFQADQIVKFEYLSATGNIQDLALNPLLDIINTSVINNIAEGSAILESISLTADTTNPSSKAEISWNTKTNVNGIGVDALSTTENEIEYGITQLLGLTQSSTTGNSVATHSAHLTGLTPNTLYYYRVKSEVNGKTSYSQIFSFTTSQTDTDLHTDSISLLQSFAEFNDTTPYSSGWHFRFNITIDNVTEDELQFIFDNWVSGTNALLTTGNVKMIVSSTGTTSTESEITAGASVSTTYAGGDTVDISAISDGNPNIAGKQLVLDLYIKIPDGQPGGSYSSSFGIKTF